jgi:hypothetical protein
MALEAANQEQRFVGTVRMTPAVDPRGVFLAPRRGERFDAAHLVLEAFMRPRIGRVCREPG